MLRIITRVLLASPSFSDPADSARWQAIRDIGKASLEGACSGNESPAASSSSS